MPAPVDSPLRFFLDRGLGSRGVPDALRAAGWQLETMDERYGTAESESLRDEDWIRDAARRGDVLLTKDLAIARGPLEAYAVWANDARMFALSNANIGMPLMAERFIVHEALIFRTARRVEGPYVMAVSANGIRRARLAYPP